MSRALHQLKIEQQWLDRLRSGDKTAEIRKHDRDFQAGDLVEFCGWNQNMHRFEGGSVVAVISHVLPEHEFPQGLMTGFCMLSLTEIGEGEAE